MWSREDVIRQLVGSVAMVVQRGGGTAYFFTHDRCLQRMHHSAKADKADESWRESSRSERCGQHYGQKSPGTQVGH